MDGNGNIAYYQFTIHSNSKPLRGATFVVNKPTFKSIINEVNIVIDNFKKVY